MNKINKYKTEERQQQQANKNADSQKCGATKNRVDIENRIENDPICGQMHASYV